MTIESKTLALSQSIISLIDRKISKANLLNYYTKDEVDEFLSGLEEDILSNIGDIGSEGSSGGASGGTSVVSGTGHEMFDLILTDHILTAEDSEGLALAGTWVYKDEIAGSRFGYPDFYNKCLEEYQNSTLTTNIKVFEQPYLASNGSMGGDSFAVACSSHYGNLDAFKAFEQVDVATNNTAWATADGIQTANFDFYNPRPLKILKLGFENRLHFNQAIRSGSILASNNYIDWTTIRTFTNAHVTPGETWELEIDMEVPYKYFRLNVTSTGGGETAVAIQKLYITALEYLQEYDTENYLYKNENGHGFYNISQKDTIDELYQLIGRAWYYGIDEENERIFLPRANESIIGVNQYVYIVVGNTIRKASLINATPITTTENDTLPLFSPMYYEFTPDSTAWKQAGTWCNGSVYTFAYSEIVNNRTNNARNLPIKLITEEYTDYDFVLDEDNNQFRLPVKTNVVLSSVESTATLYFKVSNVVQNIQVMDAARIENTKASVNMDNLTDIGKDYIAGLGMPSDRYIDLTLGASGTTYTAPANGYFVFSKTSTGSSQEINLAIYYNNSSITNQVFSVGSNNYLHTWLPVQKAKK